VPSAQLANKIIGRCCVMLGLHTPQTATLQVVEANAKRETSTDRTERVLKELLEDKRGGEKPH
jgi:hypothetical protein